MCLSSTSLENDNPNLHVSQGKVNDKTCTVMRDPGSVISVVASCFVQSNQMMDEYVNMQLINGFKCHHRVAKVKVNTPYYCGVLEACMINSPPFGLIIGNNVRDSLCPNVEVCKPDKPALAVTRSQTKSQANPSSRKLVISDVGEIVTDPKMEELQKEDPSIQELFKLAESKEERTRGKQTSKFILSKNLLYRLVSTHKGDQVYSTKQLVVPAGYRRLIFNLAHAAPLAGHQGKSKTLRRIQAHFFWPSMADEVNRWTGSCDICQKTTDKGRVKPAPIVPLPVIGEPFQRCAIDLVGPIIPASSDGHRYMLVLTDFATKWPEAIPLKSITTQAVAEALLSIFTRLGVPKEILSDRGSQFTGDMMKEVYRLMAVKGIHTTPYHPQCNGACERLNGVLKKMLKRLSAEQPKLWPKYINPLLFAYREVEHSSTGYSPFYLMYGRDVRGPLHILKETLEGRAVDNVEVRTAYQYVLELRERISQTLSLAQTELKNAGVKAASYYNKKSKLRSLKSGDKILLLLPTNDNKLLAQWQGPFEVVEKLSDLNFKVKVRGQHKVFHINMLKKYHVDRPACTFTKNMKSTTVTALIDPYLSAKCESRGQLLQEIPRFYETRSQPACAVVSANEELGQLSLLDELRQNYGDVVIADTLNHKQVQLCRDVCKNYSQVFTDSPRPAKVEPYKIQLTETTPVRSKAYSIPHKLLGKVKEEIHAMENAGYIEPSTSPYASPIVVVNKPDKSLRICGDFRKVNAHIKFDAEPMADQHDIFSRLSTSRYFSKMDLAKGFYQLKIDQESRAYTAIVTPLGLKQFTVVPFGLSISPAAFNRTIRKILQGMPQVEIFVDDILIHTQTWDEHVSVLEEVLARFKKHGVSVKPSKCELGAQGVDFLGHYVGQGIQRPQEKTLEKVHNFVPPETKKGMQSFLGLCNYYSEFIPGYTQIAQPLIATTCKKAPKTIVWDKNLQNSFLKMKEALNKHRVLKLPDVGKPFILQTDASGVGIGAALLQIFEEGEKPKPIAFWSRKLKSAETRYATIEKECLAIIEGVKKFHSYLYGATFTLETDHQPLSYLKTYAADGKNGRLTRWTLFLQDYNFNIRYIRGKDNVLADFLSRMPETSGTSQE